MILKILLALIFGIIYEIINLLRIGTVDNPIAFGFLKILIMITLILSIVSINAFNLRIIRRMKKNNTINYWNSRKGINDTDKNSKKRMINKN